MFKDLDKKIKTYSYISVITGIFVCALLIIGTVYLSMNSYSYNIINPDGTVLSIPYWPLVFAAIVLGISWYSIMLSVHGIGEILEKLTDFERFVKEENDKFEKEQLSDFVADTKVVENTPIPQVTFEPTVVPQAAEPVVVNTKLFDDSQANKQEEVVQNNFEDTMEIENKLIFEDVKKHNYRLELSNAFFDRIKPINLSSTQERAVYENVELALLTNEYLVLTTITEEGQRVNVNISTNTLGHVIDNIETLKDALKIFRKLTKIRVAKDFIWKA